MARDGVGAVVGSVGAVASCSAMMFAVFPALLGVFGSSVSSVSSGMGTASGSGMGMSGMGTSGNSGTMAGTASSAAHLPAWVAFFTHYSTPILAVSILLLLWGIRGASRAAQVLVALGIVLLIVNQINMMPIYFIPAMILVIVGNVVGYLSARKRVAIA